MYLTVTPSCVFDSGVGDWPGSKDTREDPGRAGPPRGRGHRGPAGGDQACGRDPAEVASVLHVHLYCDRGDRAADPGHPRLHQDLKDATPVYELLRSSE